MSRPAVTWLNYRGRVNPPIDSVMGPNTLGERLWVRAVQYDEATDTTRVGLSYMPPPREAS